MPFIIPAVAAIGGALASSAPALIGAAATAGIGAAGAGKGSGNKLQDQLTTLAGQRASKQDSLVDQNAGTLDQFSSPEGVTGTPFYKSLVTTATGSTANAYQNAKVALRQRANASGFGSFQPAEQGSETALDARAAGDIAKIPNAAALSTADEAMKAAGIRTGEVDALNPNGLFSNASNLSVANDNRTSSLYSGLAGLAGKLIPQLYQTKKPGASGGGGGNDTSASSADDIWS